MKSLATLLMIAFVIGACSKGNNDDDNPGGGGGGAGPTVTATSPEYVFWGKELTVNGSGFSPDASKNIVYITGNMSCGDDTTWQKATVVSASPTKLVVKVPFVSKSNGTYCGHDYGRVRVTVDGKSFTGNANVKFVGPLVMNVCHPFGVTIGNYPNTFRPGDSSVISAHLYTYYGRESGYYDKIRLSVNGSPLTSVDRTFPGATCGGLTFVLDAKTYSDINNCVVPTGYGGGPARKFTFTAKVEGTDIETSTEAYIFNQPTQTIISATGPLSLSKSAGGNHYIKVKGKYMHFNKVVWRTVGENAFQTEAPGFDVNATETDIAIPISTMTAGKSYTAVAVSQCGDEANLFVIAITP